LLRDEDVKRAALEAGFDFPPGALAENLVIEGLPGELPIGGTLAIGDSVELEILEKGKKPGEPHSYDYRGYCLLPTVGYFVRVARGGSARRGDSVWLVEKGR
ncbi:MAG: MOSC domain-containing protein, partial [Bacillota bacterium]|nr:MOSC domain-containing protein [Bacillota bacterium]